MDYVKAIDQGNWKVGDRANIENGDLIWIIEHVSGSRAHLRLENGVHKAFSVPLTNLSHLKQLKRYYSSARNL
jgi:protein subunit release factor A